MKLLGFECAQAVWLDAAQQLFLPLNVLSFVTVIDYIACFLFTILWSFTPPSKAFRKRAVTWHLNSTNCKEVFNLHGKNM